MLGEPKSAGVGPVVYSLLEHHDNPRRLLRAASRTRSWDLCVQPFGVLQEGMTVTAGRRRGVRGSRVGLGIRD